MSATTLESTRRFLARRLRVEARTITPESPLVLEGPALAELLLDIEKKFGIRLSSDCERIRTLGDLLVVVAWELAQARAGAAPGEG